MEFSVVDAEGGRILKLLDNSSKLFSDFGELYFSELSNGVFRGWRMHKQSSSLIFVISGRVAFHFFSTDEDCYSIEIDAVFKNPVGLSIPAFSNFGFRSLTKTAVIANFSSVRHSEDELKRMPSVEHDCGWTD